VVVFSCHGGGVAEDAAAEREGVQKEREDTIGKRGGQT
jgi:hypothetical protein